MMNLTHSVHTINPDPVGGRPRGQRLLSVGRTFYSAETRLADRNESGEGEFCMRGRGVMMGYLNCEDKTMESIYWTEVVLIPTAQLCGSRSEKGCMNLSGDH